MRVLDVFIYFFSITYSVGHAFAKSTDNCIYTFSTLNGGRQMATVWMDGKRKIITVPVAAAISAAPLVSRRWRVTSGSSLTSWALIQNQGQFLVVRSDGVLDLIDGPNNATSFNFFTGYPELSPKNLAHSFLDYQSNKYIVEGDATNYPDFRGSRFVTFDRKPDAAWILGAPQ